MTSPIGSDTAKLSFSVDSGLLLQLGEQLVTRPSIALAELVKNAYDADATRVEITMENIGIQGGTIFIQDDGHGMTFEEIVSGWMRIATTEKQRLQVSRKFSRTLTGAKGIGRFAARRLGEDLLLQSIAYRSDGTKEVVTVTFKWSQFQPGVNIENVPVTYQREPVDQDTPTGVSLFISDARDRWGKDEVIALRRDLLSIQSPFPDLILPQSRGSTKDPGFTTVLRIEGDNGLQELSGDIGEAFMGLSFAKLEGTIGDNGLASYSVQVRGSEQAQTLFDDDTEHYSGLEGTRLRTYFFVDERAEFGEKGFRLRDFRSKAASEGGIRIYLDGFRVFPYGEAGNDWLLNDYFASENLDMGVRVPMSQRVKELSATIREQTLSQGGDPRFFLLIPRNRQLFGAVLLSQAGGLQVTASREGLVENETFEKLRRFVQRGLYWLTLKYAAATIAPRAERRKQRREKAQTVAEIIDEARSDLKRLPEFPAVQAQTIADAVISVAPNVDRQSAEKIGLQLEQVISSARDPILETIEDRLEEASQQAVTERQETITEIAMLRLLASAGTSLMLMQHQIQAMVEQVDYVYISLRELRSRMPPEVLPIYDDLTDQVQSWHRLVVSQVSQLGNILTPDNRQRATRHALKEIVEDVRRSMSYYMEKNHVQFFNNVEPILRTPSMFQAELYAILLNILTNALKAVYGQSQRDIMVEAIRQDGKMHLRMLNTGRRISEAMRIKAFEPFESESIPHPILGTGTGLGLTVVRDTVEGYGGSVEFVDVPAPWQTGIEITIPYR